MLWCYSQYRRKAAKPCQRYSAYLWKACMCWSACHPSSVQLFVLHLLSSSGHPVSLFFSVPCRQTLHSLLFMVSESKLLMLQSTAIFCLQSPVCTTGCIFLIHPLAFGPGQNATFLFCKMILLVVVVVVDWTGENWNLYKLLLQTWDGRRGRRDPETDIAEALKKFA